MIIEDFYNELSNNGKKSKSRESSRNKKSQSAPKWKKTYDDMKKNSPRANTPNDKDNSHHKEASNGHSTKANNGTSKESTPTDGSHQQQNGSSRPTSGTNANAESKTKADFKDFDGFKFNSKSDPFELLETFAMYKLFSEMSHRLFKDVDDEEMLINLAKIISSFNLPPKNKMNTSPMNSFRKQNSGGAAEESEKEREKERSGSGRSNRKAKTPTPPNHEPQEKKKPNSDFVFSETIRCEFCCFPLFLYLFDLSDSHRNFT